MWYELQQQVSEEAGHEERNGGEVNEIEKWKWNERNDYYLPSSKIKL